MLKKILFMIFILVGSCNSMNLLNYPEFRDLVQSENFKIKDYDTSNREFVLNLIEQNWHYLTDRFTDKEQIELMLDTRTPILGRAEYRGKLNIKVLFHNNIPIGFISYYKEINEPSACIEQLCIDIEFRRGGNATKLLNHVFLDLIKENIPEVTLATNNEGAIELYLKLGFKIEARGRYSKLKKVLIENFIHLQPKKNYSSSLLPLASAIFIIYMRNKNYLSDKQKSLITCLLVCCNLAIWNKKYY